MPRNFAPISQDDLREKVDALLRKGTSALIDKLGGDIKVSFDLENFERHTGDLVGIHTFSDRDLTFWGMEAGGDWECPVYFIVYWDGKRIRGYVPTGGNLWNTDTKQAYGNDPSADGKNAAKRWPGRFDGGPLESEDVYDLFEAAEGPTAGQLRAADISERLSPAAPKVKRKSAPAPAVLTLQQRVEAAEYYGGEDEASELFQHFCRLSYTTYGLGLIEYAETLCSWAEKLAADSRVDGDPGDVVRGYWGS